MSHLLFPCKTGRALSWFLFLLICTPGMHAVTLDERQLSLDSLPMGLHPRLVRRMDQAQSGSQSSDSDSKDDLYKIGQTFLEHVPKQEAETRKKAWKYQDMAERSFTKGEQQSRKMEMIKNEETPPGLQEAQASQIRKYRAASNWRNLVGKHFKEQSLTHLRDAATLAEAPSSVKAVGWRLKPTKQEKAQPPLYERGRQPVFGHIEGVPNVGTRIPWPSPAKGLYGARRPRQGK